MRPASPAPPPHGQRPWCARHACQRGTRTSRGVVERRRGASTVYGRGRARTFTREGGAPRNTVPDTPGGGPTRLGAARRCRKDYEPALLSTPSAVSVPTRLRARARRAAAGTAGYRGAGERRIAGVTPYVCPPHVPVPPAGVGRGRRRAADTLALPPLRPLRPCVHPPLPSLCR